MTKQMARKSKWQEKGRIIALKYKSSRLFILQFGQLTDLGQGVLLKFRPQRLEYRNGFVQFPAGSGRTVEHRAFSGSEPVFINIVYFADMLQQQILGRNSAIFDVADNIAAYTKPFPEFSLRQMKSFSCFFDSIKQCRHLLFFYDMIIIQHKNNVVNT